MILSHTEKPDYSNFVSTRFIYVPAAIALALIVLSLVLPGLVPVLVAVAVCFFLIAAYFAYARHLFSPAGRNVQAQIQELVMARLNWNGQGQALDIGCGNGPLTIKLAQQCPNAQIRGIDYWGRMWAYSQSVCEKNAQIEGVATHVTFQKASASALPFPDGSFDAVVSNLVFHEVSDAKDKREVVREALRVVKNGGRFAFQDLFQEKHLYGEIDDLLSTVKHWGITKVEFIKTSDASFIPPALKLPFMVGAMGILYGEK